jgi:predicted porin
MTKHKAENSQVPALFGHYFQFMEIYRMKKSLLAVAAATAFAGAAQAQSSVTVYGILDVGFVGSTYQGTALQGNTANVNNQTPGAAGSLSGRQTTAGFGQSAESTSRIGFKGTEDLGGGLKGVFTLELGLDPNANGAAAGGTTVASTAYSAPAVFGQVNRQTFVGLSKAGVGTGTIGTQYTPIFDVQSVTDAAGNNNLVGNAVYSGSLQSGTGTFNQGLSAYSAGTSTVANSLNALSGAYVTRLSNSIKFQSDRFHGFAAQAYYAQANQNTNASGLPFTGVSGAQAVGGVGASSTSVASVAASSPGGQNNNTAFGFNADYEWNKLKVVAAYQSIKSFDPSVAAAVTTSSSTLAGGTAASYGLNMADSSTYAAATYDFGILKGYAQYITRRAYSAYNSNYGTNRTAYQLGARSQITPTVSVYATYGLGKSAYWGSDYAGANFRTFQIGSDYNLSKRTNLYAAYGSVNQSSTGTTTSTGTSAMNYALGIRHTF